MLVEKSKLYEYLFEVIVIFVGITISFYVDSWKQSNEEEKLEREYLNGFVQDLNLDQKNLGMALASIEVVNRSSLKLLGCMARREFEPDSFYVHTANIIEVNDFKPTMHTYEEIRSNSHLKLIKDDSLRKQIIDLYEFYKHLDFVDALARKQQLEYYLPYITDRIDQEAWGIVYDNGSVMGNPVYVEDSKKLINDVKFKNCVINVNSTFGQTKLYFEEGNQKCMALLAKIQEKVPAE